MSDYLSKFQEWLKVDQLESFEFNGISLEEWIITHLFTPEDSDSFSGKNFLFICKNQSSAFKHYNRFKDKSFLFYQPDYSPYEQFIVSDSDFSQYLDKLHKISNTKKTIIFTTFRSIFQKLPPKSFFQDSTFEIKQGETLRISDLKDMLHLIGFKESFNSSSNQTYCQKGEIFDIRVNDNSFYRLQFFDDEVEKIYNVDPLSFKSIKDLPLQNITLGSNLNSIYDKSLLTNLRENIPLPKTSFKNKLLTRNDLFSKLQNSELVENIHYLLPLFFKEQSNLLNYLPSYHLVFENFELSKSDYLYEHDLIKESYEISQSDISHDSIFPKPEELFDSLKVLNKKFVSINSLSMESTQGSLNQNKIYIDSKNLKEFLGLKGQYEKSDFINTLFDKIKNQKENLRKIYFTGKRFEEIKEFFENHDISITNLVHIKKDYEKSFVNSLNNSLYLSSKDIFYSKKTRKVSKKKQNIDFFAEQLSSLKAGDFIVHKNFGVGKFVQVTNLQNNNGSDFIEIEYKDKDKVYVPVYNLDLIQKYADANSSCTISDLKSKKFNLKKSKARLSAKKLAFDIIKLQAERNAHKGHAFSQPGSDYIEFENDFPYELTKDQASAVDEILTDMCSDKPMDRLVCGDVGFGKTEVAMRAAFKAIEDGKQVAVLVPTTILSLQHFMNFKERFKKFAVNIDYISRFKSTKESNEIFEKIQNANLDIIVGTHKLLSNKVKFNNLGLVIIDEEHRFGVAQKEKLKLLKASTDFLTLTATPIPRTLQLAFLGVKDVSLIQTPPPKRQSINTFMVRDDHLTIKNAIEKELKRNGQVFIIHNKVQDIEILVSKIRSLVPEAKIVYAHGQLNEKDLEKRIQSFFDKKFDILISTTIVESGIDIPTANTMIINNSHTFGLAQLHQLRGRIGRSTRKAFCYFLIPKSKKLSKVAEKRLEALQRYSDLGSGFALASSDLEIRGAGDILGAEQSGHIQNIGMELYSEMLNDAIQEIKGEKTSIEKFDIDVNLTFPSYISKNYIQDQNTRLKYYKKISNAQKDEVLNSLNEELIDIYGSVPEETQNLFNLIKIRNLLSHLPVTQIKINEKFISLKLNERFLSENPEKRNKIVNFFMSDLGKFQLKPNFLVRINTQQKSSEKSFDNLKSIFSTLLV